MGWLDRLLGREAKDPGRTDVTPAEHERHLEQSANPGSAPAVPPDKPVGDETSTAPTVEETRSASEVQQAQEEARNAEATDETRLRDDQEGRFTREPPRSY